MTNKILNIQYYIFFQVFRLLSECNWDNRANIGLVVKNIFCVALRDIKRLTLFVMLRVIFYEKLQKNSDSGKYSSHWTFRQVESGGHMPLVFTVMSLRPPELPQHHRLFMWQTSKHCDLLTPDRLVLASSNIPHMLHCYISSACCANIHSCVVFL